MSELLPLHKIAFATPPVPAPDLGVRGDMVWLYLCDLVIDPRYQRPILAKGRKNIERIIAGFSWSLFSPLIVAARPGGKYAIIDGQHRATAAKSHGGITQVPCMVIDGDEAQEARAFALINGQVTSVTPNQIFHARMHGREPKAVALAEVLAAAEVKVLRSLVQTDLQKPGETMAISTLESCLARYGKDVLITALQTVTQTHDGNAGYLRSPIIGGTCMVLAENPIWLNAGDQLFQAVETAGIPALYRRAMEIRLDKKGTMLTNYAAVLRNHLTETMPRKWRPHVKA